jgi:predicted DNA-binding transcriptional regulator AlpA
MSSERLLRLPDVQQRVPYSGQTIHRHVKAGLFPKPIYIGRSKVWPQSVIDAWMEAKTATCSDVTS